MSDVRCTVDGHVAEIVLDRPSALNAISTAMSAEVAVMCRELPAHARAVVVSSSSERAFCVGADLKERSGFSDAELLAQRASFRSMSAALLAVSVPMIAAVAGYALGGGLEIALCCDLIVADETAVVGLPEVSVGLVPGLGGTALLTRRAGYARAADLVLTGRRVPAAEALRLGVVDRVVPAGTARAAARELAATIAGHSPVAVRAARAALRDGLGVPLAAGLEIEDAAWRATAMSADRAEGIRAFVERRPPVWPSP